MDSMFTNKAGWTLTVHLRVVAGRVSSRPGMAFGNKGCEAPWLTESGVRSKETREWNAGGWRSVPPQSMTTSPGE